MCALEQVGLSGEGRGRVDDVIDIRGQKSLSTDNMGEIKITRRRIKSDVLKSLQELSGLLSSADADEIAVAVQ